MSKKPAAKWLLETLTTLHAMSVEEIEAKAAGQFTFGELMTHLNKLLIDRKVKAEGESPIRWRLAPP